MELLSEEQWLARKDSRIHRNLKFHRGFPVFSNIEFNLVAACTRRCPFCPASNPEYYRVLYAGRYPKRFPMDLYRRILEDLQEIGYGGDVSYSGFSEPLLHPDLEEMIRRTKMHLASARTIVITNGDLLTEPRTKALFDAGLDEMVISVYDGAAQLERLQRVVARSGAPESRVLLRGRYAVGGRYDFSLSNRCGLVDVKTFGQTEQTLPLRRKCYYPFTFIKVDLDGDVLYCPHNWIKLNTLGNAQNGSLWGFWTGEKLENVRRDLARADRKSLPCSRCDVEGTKNGEESFLAWKNTQNT